jgi:hypothetical protein
LAVIPGGGTACEKGTVVITIFWRKLYSNDNETLLASPGEVSVPSNIAECWLTDLTETVVTTRPDAWTGRGPPKRVTPRMATTKKHLTAVNTLLFI